MSFRYTIETENPIVTDGNKMFNCKDGKLRLKIVEDNPWHTGTPTITGLYVVKFKDGGYDVILYDNGKVFEGDDPLCGWDIYSDEKPEDIIKWQLLEEASK